MMAMGEKVVIGVAGMPGAGKAVVRDILREMGCPVVVMGDEVRIEAERRGLRPTPKNLGQLMLRLREEEGPAAVARRCVPKVKNAEEDVVVVDGVRSLHEVEEFKRHFRNFILVAVHSSPETRFRRLSQRGRSDDPKTRKAFVERDMRELGVGLGDVIATADYMIVNEGTKKELRRRARRILEEAMGRWMR